MRIAPRNTEEWFRHDRRVAIYAAIGVVMAAGILTGMKLLGRPLMGWREVMLPILWVCWLPPVVWGQAYLARYLNLRQERRNREGHGASAPDEGG